MEALRIIVGGSLLVFFTILFTWIGMYHGQWFSSNLLRRGKKFRRQTPAKWFWLSTSSFWLSVYLFPWLQFLRPLITGTRHDFPLMESVQRSPLCIMVIGSVLAGAIVGFRSSKPVGLTGAIIISCLMLPLAWLSMTHPVPILRIPIFIAYGVAISTVVLNTFIWYRSRKSSEHIIANPEEIPILNLREKVRSLLKDGRLFPRQPAVRSLKYAQVHFQDSPVRMHAYCKPSGVYFYASSGIEGADPSAPGTEFLPIAVVWLFIPWANIETLKTEHIIGYSEVALRLKNSGLQLRLEGLTRKQLAQFDSLQIPDFQLKLKTE